jgi:hypothetical protein
MLKSSHAIVRLEDICAHLAALIGPFDAFKSMLIFEDERFGSTTAVVVPCVDFIVPVRMMIGSTLSACMYLVVRDVVRRVPC